jgi:hypothetical protein
MAVIKVKPWGEGQGDFVFIEEENFDSNFHKHYEEKKEVSKPKSTKKAKNEEG